MPEADTASAAGPAQRGNLAVTSITSAAVIGEADDPCSVNTAYDLSHLLLSPRSTTRPLYSWWFQLGTLEMTEVNQCSKVNFPFRFCVLPE